MASRPKFLTQMEWFELVCRDMLDLEIKPTPTILEDFDPSFVTRKGKNITLSHGRLGALRRKLMREYGWRYDNRRWHLPDDRVIVRMMSGEMIIACPHFIIHPDHYRADGSCRCDDPDHDEMKEWEYVWDGSRWN